MGRQLSGKCNALVLDGVGPSTFYSHRRWTFGSGSRAEGSNPGLGSSIILLLLFSPRVVASVSDEVERKASCATGLRTFRTHESGGGGVDVVLVHIY